MEGWGPSTPSTFPWPGWLDLGDAVAIAYGESEGYEGATNPKDAAQKLINKVCAPNLGRTGPQPAGLRLVRSSASWAEVG